MTATHLAGATERQHPAPCERAGSNGALGTGGRAVLLGWLLRERGSLGERGADLAAAMVRWVAVLVGAVTVARGSSSAAPVLWGAPLVATACLWTACGHRQLRLGPRLVSAALAGDVLLAALAVSRTGGWHSSWTVTLVGEVTVGAFSVPTRAAGPAAAAALAALAAVDLTGRGSVPPGDRSSFGLDGLLLVAALSVSYASWLIRWSDRDRAHLAVVNQRLMATNDLLVLVDQVLLRGEDPTDPYQAARAVSLLCRRLFAAEPIMVACTWTEGSSWKVLHAEGVAVAPDGSGVGALAELGRLAAAAPPGAPLEIRPPFLATESSAGVGLPLVVRGRLVGAVVMEKPDRAWGERERDLMGQLAPWAALLVDNACRFHSLWVVGSAAQQARVARDLHDNLGQSMAALGLQLDALARTVADPDHARYVRDLRAEVTGMVAELRYTMRDLVCDVSSDKSLGVALEQLVRGLTGRTGTRFQVEVSASRRLPLAQEHQILQMARTLVGAGMRSRYESVTLRWAADGDGGRLEVGFRPGSAGAAECDRPIREALGEVRDRGWAVGATIEYETEPDGRSRVVCRVGP